MGFLTEPEPRRDEVHWVTADIGRLVARNPGSMTYHGTNTYIIRESGGFIVLDPGPAADSCHVESVVRATGGRIRAILISHGHSDHCGAIAALRERQEAPIYAYHEPLGAQFTPDVPLRDGERIGSFIALHTPGHAPDHLCFAHDDGLVFTGDHVMAWSSTVVSPPFGDMRAYLESLERLIRREDKVYLPGHGPALPDPRNYVRELRRRRMNREREILETIRSQAISVPEISKRLYAKLDPVLQNAAERNIISHLLKLQAEGRVESKKELWITTR